MSKKNSRPGSKPPKGDDAGGLVPKALFFLSCAFLIYGVGLATAIFRLPPYGLVKTTVAQLKETFEYKTTRLDWQYFNLKNAPTDRMIAHDPAAMMPGATLISGFTDDPKVHSVNVVTKENDTIQAWNLDWDNLWSGSPEHIPKSVLRRPQKHPHGAQVASNGDLVFNFTELATFRVNTCGDLVWQLEERGHHSIDIAEDGTIWVPGVITHFEPVPEYPNHKPPFEEFTVMHVSADGEILQQFSVNQLLADNGYSGLLYSSTRAEMTPIVTGDTLHLNDLEVFPESMEEGVFKHGDLLLSLRNINTIIVVDPATLKIRFIDFGKTLRQHDADFIDGNTISIFDNNNLLPEWLDNISGVRGAQGQSSKIVTISALTGEVTASFDGGVSGPFFTDLMGNQQGLDNGNLLVVESRAGRAFEAKADGTIVWEYMNTVAPDRLGAISQAERLPETMDAAFFESARAACGG